MIAINDVHKSFGEKHALDGVSLQITDGTVYGLLGPNGAGKTTLIRIMNGITAPDRGEALLNGHRITLQDAADIGYLPEERGLYKKMKVGEQVLYLAQLKGMSRADAVKEARWWFNRFDILSWKDKKVEELSKGMAQKIQFITTVIHHPQILILDEPFSGFDPVNTEQIRQEILRLNKEGVTVVLSTHNMESVETLCDEISLINHGKIVLQGKVNDIRNAHSTHRYKAIVKTDDTVSESVFQLKPQETANDLLQQLITQGEVVSFEEIIPSMNEIFIKTVEQ